MTTPHEQWRDELLAQTEKSWGFIATESKQALMMDDFKRREAFVDKVRKDAVREALENLAAEVEEQPNVYSIASKAKVFSETKKLANQIIRKHIEDL